MTRTRRRLVALAALVLLGAGVAVGTYHDLTATRATTNVASTYYDLSPTHH